MDSRRVVILGWYDNSNLGDESYKLSFPKIINNKDLIFVSDVNSIKTILHDEIILGGGDCLNEDLLTELLQFKCKKSLLSVSISKIFKPELLKQFDIITVRDFISFEKAKMSNHNLNVQYVPDFAFALDNVNNPKNINNILNKNKIDVHDIKIGIIINSHLYSMHNSLAKEYAKFNSFAFDIAALIDNIKANFIFIPFCTQMPWDDRIANGMIASKCKWWKKNLLIYDILDTNKTLELFNQLDLIISMRYHSTLFSFITNTPFVDIIHGHKNLNFLKTISKENWGIDYWTFNIKLLEELIKQKINNNSIKQEMKNITIKNKEIINNFKYVYSL